MLWIITIGPAGGGWPCCGVKKAGLTWGAGAGGWPGGGADTGGGWCNGGPPTKQVVDY